MDKAICLSAGHQLGVDNGAAYGGLYEADLTIQITTRAVEIIRKHGIQILEVPNNVSLVGTISWINARKDQIAFCVDIHINAGGGTGVEGWYYQGGGPSKQLAQYIVDAMAAETGLRIRGNFDETTNRWGRLGFIHDTVPLACLVECGFIDGHPDFEMLKTPAGIEKFARGVARGCISYYGKKWQPELLNPATSAPEPQPPAVTIDYKKAVEESKRYVFGYQTEGTVTQRMAKIIEIYKNNGVKK